MYICRVMTKNILDKTLLSGDKGSEIAAAADAAIAAHAHR